jgi:uncharacterized membrane protein YeaQ/YmgE (transglycosylase-associated protein family)
MSTQTLVIWLVVGLVSGWLASAAVGGGFGVLGDIVIGVIGAFVGGLVFRALGLHAPFGGLAGTVVVAFLGAVLLLLVLRVARRARV